MLQNETNLYPTLTSGWEVGEPPTSETIRQGTVRMEEHPNYEAAIQKAKNAGFEIRVSGKASVEWIELYDLDHHLVRIEKILHVAAGMRYLDLEHELGHIDQLMNRFGDNIPPTDKKIELPNGYRRNVDVLAGIMTIKLAIIIEYHNRLVEFIRLYKRRIDVEVLKDHISGVEYWKTKYIKKGINNGNSTSGVAWTEKYFADIPTLEKQYDQAIQVITLGQYTAGQDN